MGTDLKDAFDAFYRRFVLRDLLGKIIPGEIAILSFGAAFGGVLNTNTLFDSLSFGVWLGVMGLAWLVGFAVQSLGEALHLIAYYPRASLFREIFSNDMFVTWTDALARIQQMRNLTDVRALLAQVRFKSDSEFYQYWNPLQAHLADNAEGRQAIERMVVIKEACGNGYISLLVSWLILLSCKWTSKCLCAAGGDADFIIYSVALGILAIFLARMHFVHVRRQQQISVFWITKNLWSTSD